MLSWHLLARLFTTLGRHFAHVNLQMAHVNLQMAAQSTQLQAKFEGKCNQLQAQGDDLRRRIDTIAKGGGDARDEEKPSVRRRRSHCARASCGELSCSTEPGWPVADGGAVVDIMSASNLACRDAAVTASSDRDASATESNGDELVHVAPVELNLLWQDKAAQDDVPLYDAAVQVMSVRDKLEDAAATEGSAALARARVAQSSASTAYVRAEGLDSSFYEMDDDASASASGNGSQRPSGEDARYHSALVRASSSTSAMNREIGLV
jgi:hypothetical protein